MGYFEKQSICMHQLGIISTYLANSGSIKQKLSPVYWWLKKPARHNLFPYTLQDGVIANRNGDVGHLSSS